MVTVYDSAILVRLMRHYYERKLLLWLQTRIEQGIIQGTKTWRERKVKTIGGSELSIITGDNPWTNTFKWLLKKLGLDKGEGSTSTRWGNLFEDIIKLFVEIDKRTKIVADESFIPGNRVNGTSYSPDGFGIVDIIIQSKSSSVTTCHDMRMLIALFEFKCPFGRIPTGKVPRYYLKQVKMGLDICDIADIAIFVEGVFRRCALEDLGNNNRRDTSLQASGPDCNPLAYGIIGFYIRKDAPTNIIDKIRDVFTDAGYSIEQRYRADQYYNDLGCIDSQLLEQVLYYYDEKIIAPWYSNITVMNSDNKVKQCDEYQKFVDYADENQLIVVGVMPWKLFQIHYNYVERTINYLDKYKDKIDEVVTILEEAQKADDIEQKWRLFNRFSNRKSSIDDL